MDKPKGKGMALLALLGRKKPSSSEDDGALPGSTSDEPSTPDMGGGDTADMAISELSDTLGVPDEQKESFTSDFKAAVKACMDSSY